MALESFSGGIVESGSPSEPIGSTSIGCTSSQSSACVLLNSVVYFLVFRVSLFDFQKTITYLIQTFTAV
jgi:hypothetical protein